MVPIELDLPSTAVCRSCASSPRTGKGKPGRMVYFCSLQSLVQYGGDNLTEDTFSHILIQRCDVTPSSIGCFAGRLWDHAILYPAAETKFVNADFPFVET
ncbi:hypothetical protein FRB94_013548 [Tulasnella sp. JGI-2019a]|nr:hypothetical protein FRB93_005109 [Tulasnella sp. JGI-2019a]KAG9014238.1 hypothetical protein FRB94_013548 [Tulasnella sp. JGI-2019a]KAG9035958.1 hypothetical protein FRB95_010166 [Tulasnella sp. JGI-2019a]